MPCVHACGSPIQQQGVRSGGRGGAEPPHQQMTGMAWTVSYALCSCVWLPHPHCVEGSTSWPVSVKQGPFAHRELIQGMPVNCHAVRLGCPPHCTPAELRGLPFAPCSPANCSFPYPQTVCGFNPVFVFEGHGSEVGVQYQKRCMHFLLGSEC